MSRGILSLLLLLLLPQRPLQPWLHAQHVLTPQWHPAPPTWHLHRSLPKRRAAHVLQVQRYVTQGRTAMQSHGEHGMPLTTITCPSISTGLQAESLCPHSGLLCQRTAVHLDAAAAAASKLPNSCWDASRTCCKHTAYLLQCIITTLLEAYWSCAAVCTAAAAARVLPMSHCPPSDTCSKHTTHVLPYVVS